jgi:xylose isomerase
LRKIKAILDEAGITVNTVTCSLHGNKLFRNGGLANPDPEIRAFARKKVERMLRIGALFNAKHYTYWVARDGFEVPVCTDWKEVYNWIADGLNHVTDYIQQNNMTNYTGATIEPKPNEPRGQMFLPTSGHAAGFIYGRLNHPEFWGVNPELLQHESMCLLNSCMTVGYLCSMDLLKFIHFGSQIKGQFDNDFLPLIGPEGLKETVFMFKALKDLNWKGILEYDCHMLRAEGNPCNADECRMQFIRNAVEATAIAIELADRIQSPDMSRGQSAADLQSIRQMCNL